jgi:hypothetical protein
VLYSSFMNPLLQLLYHLSSVRQLALEAQYWNISHWVHNPDLGDRKNSYDPAEYIAESQSLLCELGFLFHIFEVTQRTFISDMPTSNSKGNSNSNSDQRAGVAKSSREVARVVDKVARAVNLQRVLSLVPEAVALGL